MKVSQFSKDAPGALRPVPAGPPRVPPGVLGFVPNPLPPKLDLDWGTAGLLSAADRFVGELAGLSRLLPNPDLMVRPFLNREAVLSSRIEGATTTVQELMISEADLLGRTEVGDILEIRNYSRTMEYGLERLQVLPLSLRFILELHERLMAGVRGGEHAGKVRDVQNYIGHESGIVGARFVPPPVPDLKRTLDSFERFLAESREFPPLVHIALVHYQFETIHPFRDGNGRIGRLLSAMLLCAPGRYGDGPLLPTPLLYLSAYFEQRRQEYYDRLLAVSTRGKWNEWVTFFLKAVLDQSQDAIGRSQRLLALWEEFRDALQKARVSSLLLQLVDHLFATPFITVPGAQRLLGVTYPAAANCIARLVAAGILQDVPAATRPRMFVAGKLMDILREE